ncbi:MAG: TrkA family potassium uptake protein, partial [Oscillospiraceae bacterium]|nr:TrkA family potassium uptake protein [Oscillospiraceae bacterium]
MKKTYAVFGLGRYGQAVAKELISFGAEVIAVDIDEETVNDAVGEIPFCKCADITDPDVIKQLGISNVDVVIIAMASNLEASVMATMLCKEAGVSTVIVKCANEMNCRILERIGADKVVFPERESGVRLAKNLVSSGFMDIMELSEDISMIELNVRDEWQGKTPVELNLRRKYGINIVAIYRGEKVTIEIDPSKPLEKYMKLIVIANTNKLERLR